MRSTWWQRRSEAQTGAEASAVVCNLLVGRWNAVGSRTNTPVAQARPNRSSRASTCRVVFSTVSGFKLIESIPSSTRNSAMSG